MQSTDYISRRGAIEDYFDRTAAEAWKRLTSDAPVSGIRATVRAGRDRMRAVLLSYLPRNLSGLTVLDAGCGTGALAVEAARHGARVIAVDVSGSLIDVARDRTPAELRERIDYHVGDMLDPAFGEVDHAVMMDSLIHYETDDAVAALAGLADRCRASMAFTLAPRTPMLSVMHAVGKMFPRSDRAPSIVPAAETRLRRSIERAPELGRWQLGRSERIKSGFYQSQAYELTKVEA